MPKPKYAKRGSSNSQRKLTENQRRLLLATPETVTKRDPITRKIRELLSVFPLELRRRWAEEWREEHRRSK
jgi:hypothetical protein